MNGRGRRSKGQRGERELVSLLSEQLGQDIVRNLEQARSGGVDLLGVGGFAVECKRQDSLNLSAWWRLACEQAQSAENRHVLAYRQSRRPWRFIIEIGAVNPNFEGQPFTIEMCLQGFCLLVRETL